MGFLTRLRTGWGLARDSFGVLRTQPSLAVFPVISGIAGLAFLTLILGGSFVFGGFESDVLTYAVLFVLYLGLTFLASFFNAALVYSAREVFDGREPTVGEGLRAAWRHRTPLFVWAVVAATVGVLLRAIESQDNLVAEIAAALFSVAWSVITYFIVPVIVFEDVGVGEMFRRSGETFKNTWGETAGAEFGISLITAAFTFVGLALAVVIFVALGGSTVGFVGALAIGGGVVVVAAVFGNALGATAKTALYVYATEDRTPEAFESVDFRQTP
ncbi:DUF6159 family protein [Halosimplex sp. J119]